MDVGLQMVFATYGCPKDVTDQQCWDEELAIAAIAAVVVAVFEHILPSS